MAELANRHHGVSSTEINNGTRPISDLASQVIGLVATAKDADATKLPVDEPVFFASVQDAIKYSGDDGTLSHSLQAILDQSDAPIIIVRAQEGETQAETEANIVGKNEKGRTTGIKALSRANARTGVTPRILGCPVYDSQIVTTELVAQAQSMLGFVYAAAPDLDDPAEVAKYRENFGQRELMLIDDNFTRFDPLKQIDEQAYTIARAMGLRAKLDQEQGWHKSLSNVNVNGVTGIAKGRSWALTDSNTEANFLNNKDITTLIRENGFKFWGNRTTSDDPLFAFEVTVRTGQMIRETIAKAHQWAVDKPMSPTLIKDIRMGVQNKLDQWIRDGKLLGASIWIDVKANDTDRVKSGGFALDYDYTAVPPLENLHFNQRITDRYILPFVNGLVASQE